MRFLQNASVLWYLVDRMIDNFLYHWDSYLVNYTRSLNFTIYSIKMSYRIKYLMFLLKTMTLFFCLENIITKRKFKQCWSTIPQLLTKRTILSHTHSLNNNNNNNKESQQMTLVTHVVCWDGHTHVAVLNLYMGSQSFPNPTITTPKQTLLTKQYTNSIHI
jgi:hypothetical protein